MIDLKNKDTLRKYFELTDRALQLIDDQAEEHMTRGDLQGCVEAIILEAMNFQEIPAMDPVEKELRRIWDKKGVPKEKQDEVIADITSKDQPGAKIGPFVIGGARAIIIVRGGVVQGVCSNLALDVDVLDWDDFNASADEEERAMMEKLSKEADKLIAVY